MKKISNIFIALILVLSIALPFNVDYASARGFTDVPANHSNYNDIMYLLELGVVDDSNAFNPASTATRQDVAVMLAKALKLDGTPRATQFKDVPSSNKNSGYIQSAAEAGIIKGFEGGKFKPNDKVTRGHMATFVSRAFDLPNGTKTFRDVKKGNTAYEAVSQLAAANITSGYEDGTFKPSNNLTKAHLATFVARAVRYAESSGAGNNTSPKPPTTAKNDMKVHFIDVGQGDSTLIQLASGENVLVDAGTDAAGEKVVAYLKSLGVKKLDYAIATHPDADHIGGMVDVINAFPIGTFLDSGKIHTSKTFENMLLAIDAKNIKYSNPKVGQVYEYDQSIESYFQVLHADSNADENNDASIVVKGGYCNNDFMLMGDASTTVESKIVRDFDNLDVGILKAGHHGSNTSSSLNFMKAVNPEAVILSYGEGNSYGHPHKEVMANIKSIGAKAYSTAQDGTIVATIDCDGITLDASEFKYEEEYIPPTTKPEETPGSLFKNCTELKAVYPNGVPVGHAAYELKHDGDNDGWACETDTVTPTPEPDPIPPVIPTTPPTTDSGKKYKNCTELRKDYPNGVSSSHPSYEKKHDRDGDGYACE